MRGIGALILTLLVLVVAGCGGGTLSRGALDKEISAAQSLAAEGALLAGQVAHGETTVPFARVHGGELAKEAQSLDRSLASARLTPGLADRRARAVQLTDTTAALLHELHRAPGDREVAARLRPRLEDAAEQLEGLGS